jgi:hypothetical protein
VLNLRNKNSLYGHPYFDSYLQNKNHYFGLIRFGLIICIHAVRMVIDHIGLLLICFAGNFRKESQIELFIFIFLHYCG